MHKANYGRRYLEQRGGIITLKNPGGKKIIKRKQVGTAVKICTYGMKFGTLKFRIRLYYD